MGSYYLTSTARPVGYVVADQEVSLETTNSGAGTILSLSVPTSAASSTVRITFAEPSGGGPGVLDWAAANNSFTTIFDVTTCSSSVSHAASFTRMSADTNTTLASTIAALQSGTGLKTFSGSILSPDASSSRATTDVYVTTLRNTNSSSMTTGSLAIRVDENNSTATVPWAAFSGGSTVSGAATAASTTSVTASGTLTKLGIAAPSSAASVAAAGTVTGFDIASPAASANISAASAVQVNGAVTPAAAANVSTTGVVSVPGAASPAASASVTADATVTRFATAAPSAVADIAVSGFDVQFAAAAPSAIADVTVSGGVLVSGAAAVQIQVDITAAGVVSVLAAAAGRRIDGRDCRWSRHSLRLSWRRGSSLGHCRRRRCSTCGRRTQRCGNGQC